MGSTSWIPPSLRTSHRPCHGFDSNALQHLACWVNDIPDPNTQTDKTLSSRANVRAKKKIFIRRIVGETVSDGGNMVKKQ